MFTPPSGSSSPPTSSSTSALGGVVQSIFSYDGNVMLAAIISLLSVILFVLLLQVYAKWYLAQARQRSRRSSISVSHVLGPARFRNFNTTTIDTSLSATPTNGLEPHVISSIPLFVYEHNHHKNRQGLEEFLECAICLSFFEEQDMGRKLRKCGHAFHVECIDMWLHAHANCPICRAPATENKIASHSVVNDVMGVEDFPSITSGSSASELSNEIDIVVEITSSDSFENENVLRERDTLSSCSSNSGSLKRILSRNPVQPSSASGESLDN